MDAVTVTAYDWEGGEERSLLIRRGPDGSFRVACLRADNPTGSSLIPVTLEELAALNDLPFGETLWIKAAGQPVLRFSGRGDTVEMAENRDEGAGPWMLRKGELQEAIQKIASP